MATEDILSIVLITYNRTQQFEKTLEVLFALDSPLNMRSRKKLTT